VGSRFALSRDSGMRDDLRRQLIEANAQGDLKVQTSPVMSPTGYPIKYVPLAGTLSEPEVYEARRRVCNRLYLAQSHFESQPDGTVKETYLCPAMPDWQYAQRGGSPEETEGRVCLCNALLSTAGFYSDHESPIVTLGASGEQVTEDLTAREVMEEILSPGLVAEAERQLQVSGATTR